MAIIFSLSVKSSSHLYLIFNPAKKSFYIERVMYFRVMYPYLVMYPYFPKLFNQKWFCLLCRPLRRNACIPLFTWCITYGLIIVLYWTLMAVKKIKNSTINQNFTFHERAITIIISHIMSLSYLWLLYDFWLISQNNLLRISI